MPLSFRSADFEDVDRVIDLVESAYRGERSRAGWTTEADLLGGQRTDAEEVRDVIGDPRASLILGFSAGELVGSVLVRIDADAHAHIGMFAVSPLLQSRGLGGALLTEAERVAHQRGAGRAKMSVIEQRLELLAWYARRGYQPTGETEPFPYGNPRFGLPRRDDLRFVVLEKRLVVAVR
jgi:ribosomal protein S18 acetylase RimI-like enzyme